jgi:sigma-B regulation protein RsbU (phosphoserine phosphatase)
MSYNDSLNQRDVYKLVERITEGNFSNELDFLKVLIQEIVEHQEFKIIGGRLWVLDGENKVYTLSYQFGNLQKIPDGYTLKINEQPILKELHENRTTLNYENDPILIESGIIVYSVTGVGEIFKYPDGKYFKYILGFNAPEILQSFYETLSIISSVATLTIYGLSMEIEQKRMSRDLSKASEIQRNLLPEHYVEFHDYKIYGICIPDSAIGGDYFDYLMNTVDEEERIGIVICDAASKGLPAAIQALFVSGAIRMAQAFNPKISTLFSRLNTLIYDTFPYERIVTLFYCELSLTSNRLVVYANAGHCSPIYYRREKDSVTMLEPTGGLLGIVRNQKFSVENIIMRPGDLMVLYTDGITEAHDKSNDFYGEERLIQKIRELRDLSPKEIAVLIIEDVQKFSAGSEYTDDRTLIVVKRDEQNGEK